MRVGGGIAWLVAVGALGGTAAAQDEPVTPPAQPVAPADCRASKACRDDGRCSARPDGCVAGSHADCWGSIGCKRSGRCTAWIGQCVVGSVVDCKRSAACATERACTARQGRCVAGSNVDCQQSVVCRQFERCIAYGGWCRTELVVRERRQREQDGPVTGLSAKLAAGAAFASLHGHPIGAFTAKLALGLQAHDLVAFHFDSTLWKGETDQGLGLFMATTGPSFELSLGRFRPGVGAAGHWLSIDRATSTQNMKALAVTGRAYLDVDILQGDHANLFVGAEGSGGKVFDGLALFTGSLSLGGRFKAP